ncbi:hypothetical protein PIB30_097108, partial [Stylosanthes scabra]|nr:hypothetical protein [Stylosanthes scabra]
MNNQQRNNPTLSLFGTNTNMNHLRRTHPTQSNPQALLLAQQASTHMRTSQTQATALAQNQAELLSQLHNVPSSPAVGSANGATPMVPFRLSGSSNARDPLLALLAEQL